MTIPRMSPRTLCAALLVAATATAGLSGCSSKDAETAPTPTPVEVPASAAAGLPKAPTFNKAPAGAVMDVKVVNCPTEEGKQTAKLELTNSQKTARDYAITVIWMKNGSGTPVGSALVTSKAAAPGKKISLEAQGKVLMKADKCVLNVLAGSLK